MKHITELNKLNYAEVKLVCVHKKKKKKKHVQELKNLNGKLDCKSS